MYILILAFMLLLFSHLSLRDRVKQLEERLTDRSKNPSLSPLPVPNRTESVAIPAAPRYAPTLGVRDMEGSVPDPLAAPSAPGQPSALVQWFKEQMLIKVGGLLFFLGAAWFVSYAIKEGWLPPSVRVLLGFALALATYVLAYQRSAVSLMQYMVLTALASSIFTVSALAGTAVFGLYPPAVALCLVAVGVAYTAFVSFSTRAEWLMVVAALAGLSAPLFTDLQNTPTLLLGYLLVLTSALLLAGQKWVWRINSLILLIGVSWYESSLVGSLPAAQLWLFVCSFSLLFFLSVTGAMVATKTPTKLDVLTMIIAGAWYVGFASTLATSPALATFIATFIVAFVGYVLYSNRLPDRVVAVYLALAGVGVLIGTSFLFSGYSLVLAYALECAVAFLLATHLALPERFVSLLAAVYVLPVGLSLPLLSSDRWRGDLWHSEAIAVYAVWAMLVISALWLVHRPGVAVYASSRSIASIFAVSGFLYGYVVIAVVAATLFSWPDSYVMMYLLQAVLSLIVIIYTMKTTLPTSVVKVATCSILLPFTFSLASLFSPDWQLGVHHTAAFGVWTMAGFMVLAILLLTQHYCREYDVTLRSLNGWYIFITTLFVFAVLKVTWDGLFVPAVADIATYVSYALIVYFLCSLFTLAQSPFRWLFVGLSGFFLPVLLSLRSLDFSGWSPDELSVQLTGVFAVTVVSALLSLGLMRRLYGTQDTAQRETLRQFGIGLGVTAFLLATAIVWCLAQSLLAPSEAISIALFTYTVSGLGAYLYGTRRAQRALRYAGISLLTVVVLRLLLIDIWQMEMVWRFITLLGVGALFISAAFFERRDDGN